MIRKDTLQGVIVTVDTTKPHSTVRSVVTGICALLVIAGLIFKWTYDGGPKLYRVTGTVTNNGKPVADVQLKFTPVNGGLMSYDTTDWDGTFELRCVDDRMGALPGNHEVVVIPDPGAESGSMQAPKEFGTACTVEPDGKNDFTIDLSNLQRVRKQSNAGKGKAGKGKGGAGKSPAGEKAAESSEEKGVSQEGKQDKLEVEEEEAGKTPG